MTHTQLDRVPDPPLDPVRMQRKTAPGPGGNPRHPVHPSKPTVVTRDLRATQVAGAERIPGGVDARRPSVETPLSRRLREGR
jgi:hypothetical protein